MGTNIRPEVSRKNKYYIPKHSFYELKHYCLQYDDWKMMSDSLLKDISIGSDLSGAGTLSHSDNIGRILTHRERYLKKIEQIERIAKEADPILSDYILMAVTKGLNYNTLRMQHKIPAGRDLFYEKYRRFFWLLKCERP